MRALFLLASASTTLAGFAAFVGCATSDEVIAEETPTPEEAGVLPPTPTAEAADAAADATDAVVVTCSLAGWCPTSLPDTDLSIKDIWPVSEDRAFAIAESATVGVKVLEWRAQDAAWKYIDDNTQNQLDGAFAGAIWAPNLDTVYYAVGSYIYRGTRLAPPGTGWSWSRQKLEDNSHVGDPTHAAHDHGRPGGKSYPAVGVWGVDANNVYAWYSNTVFHWKSEGGAASSWVEEYVLDDPDQASEHLFFVSAAGSGPDDVSFAGVRKQAWTLSTSTRDCAILVRKTSGGFARVADGTLTAGDCAERAGLPRVGGAQGWLTDIQSTAPGAITGLKAGMEIVQLSAEGVTVSDEPVASFPSLGIYTFSSFWRSPSHGWLTAAPGIVIRGDATGDGGSYAISSLALDGNPIRVDMNRVRGTSDTNLWAIGNGYAFHKTTP